MFEYWLGMLRMRKSFKAKVAFLAKHVNYVYRARLDVLRVA